MTCICNICIYIIFIYNTYIICILYIIYTYIYIYIYYYHHYYNVYILPRLEVHQEAEVKVAEVLC